MQYQIRQSDDESFYYLLSIDDDNNQTILGEDSDLSNLQSYNTETAKLEPIPEHETRGIIRE